VKHSASSAFWTAYNALPQDVRRLADRCYAQLKTNPAHPSLHFKRVGNYWSVRVGLHYRALGVTIEGGVLWFWMGTHAQYDKLIASK
jgi:hypothetical protein